MTLSLLAMPAVQPPSKESTNTKLGQALDKWSALDGVVSIWVPESRWPFLTLPPQIVWRGELNRQMTLSLLVAHKAANYEPLRAYIGQRTVYVQSLNSQTVGIVLEKEDGGARKSIGRMIRRLLALAAVEVR
jgi:hypothetical protein